MGSKVLCKCGASAVVMVGAMQAHTPEFSRILTHSHHSSPSLMLGMWRLEFLSWGVFPLSCPHSWGRNSWN